jgi:hypothetical protein
VARDSRRSDVAMTAVVDFYVRSANRTGFDLDDESVVLAFWVRDFLKDHFLDVFKDNRFHS